MCCVPTSHGTRGICQRDIAHIWSINESWVYALCINESWHMCCVSTRHGTCVIIGSFDGFVQAVSPPQLRWAYTEYRKIIKKNNTKRNMCRCDGPWGYQRVMAHVLFINESWHIYCMSTSHRHMRCLSTSHVTCVVMAHVLSFNESWAIRVVYRRVIAHV